MEFRFLVFSCIAIFSGEVLAQLPVEMDLNAGFSGEFTIHDSGQSPKRILKTLVGNSRKYHYLAELVRSESGRKSSSRAFGPVSIKGEMELEIPVALTMVAPDYTIAGNAVDVSPEEPKKRVLKIGGKIDPLLKVNRGKFVGGYHELRIEHCIRRVFSSGPSAPRQALGKSAKWSLSTSYAPDKRALRSYQSEMYRYRRKLLAKAPAVPVEFSSSGQFELSEATVNSFSIQVKESTLSRNGLNEQLIAKTRRKCIYKFDTKGCYASSIDAIEEIDLGADGRYVFRFSARATPQLLKVSELDE